MSTRAPASARLTIGVVAHQAGVGVETVRFYHREGILAEPPKPAGGFRVYPPDSVRRIRFVKRAQELGFALREIQELLGFRDTKQASCGRVKERAERKIAEIDAKLADLRRIRGALTRVRSRCLRSETFAECPILRGFYDDAS